MKKSILTLVLFLVTTAAFCTDRVVVCYLNTHNNTSIYTGRLFYDITSNGDTVVSARLPEQTNLITDGCGITWSYAVVELWGNGLDIEKEFTAAVECRVENGYVVYSFCNEKNRRLLLDYIAECRGFAYIRMPSGPGREMVFEINPFV